MIKSYDFSNKYQKLWKKCQGDIYRTIYAIVKAYHNMNKIFLCGNGGSASDCSHWATEFLKDFSIKRSNINNNEIRKKLNLNIQSGIPAISLPDFSSTITAIGNDIGYDLVFAQLVYSLGRPGDILICISTSGNSKNVVNAMKVANSIGMKTIALTGENPNKLSKCNIKITVPSTKVYEIQEYHLPIYHFISSKVESLLFGFKEKTKCMIT